MKLQQVTNWRWIAWFLWLGTLITITVMLLVNGLDRSMTPIYHLAVDHWQTQQPLYYGSKGFNYLPAFVQVFSPFHTLAIPAGDILWRWLAVGGLSWGLWKCVCLISVENRDRAFAFVTLLSLPLSVSALRNGQSSAQLAACLVLAAWYLHHQRFTLAAIFLSVALVCKPLGIPAIGLAVMIFPGLWWRIGIGMAFVVMVPYMFAGPNYVNNQYLSFIPNLIDCMDPVGERTFADINGVLRAFDLKLGVSVLFWVQLATGLTLAVSSILYRRLGNDVQRTLIWLALSGIYIMLFTPMNEGNSYVMLAPALGLWAQWHFEQKRVSVAWIITAMSVSMAVLPDIARLIMEKEIGSDFVKFWYPLMTLFLFGILVRQMVIRISATKRAVSTDSYFFERLR